MSDVIPFEPHRTSFVEVDGSPDGDELTRNLLVVEAGIAFVADGLADLRKQEQRIASERGVLQSTRRNYLELAYSAFDAALKSECEPRQILEEFIRFRRNRNPEKVLHSERIVGNFDKLKPGVAFIDRSGHGPIAGICQTQPELILRTAPKSGRPKIFVGFNFLHHPRKEDDDDRNKYEKDKEIPVTQLGRLVVGSDLPAYATKISRRLKSIEPSGKPLFTEARAESFLMLKTLGLEYGPDFKELLENYKKIQKNKYKPVDLL